GRGDYRQGRAKRWRAGDHHAAAPPVESARAPAAGRRGFDGSARARLRAAVLGGEPGYAFQGAAHALLPQLRLRPDRKSTRLNSSHVAISYAVFCLKKKIQNLNVTNILTVAGT